MNGDPFEDQDDYFDPGSMPSTSLSLFKAPWYRRPWFLGTIGVIAVVAISVITDLPHPISKSEDTSQQNAVIKQINGDTAPCAYALKESFGFYRSELAHSLAASDLKTVKNYLLQDQTVCSFASGPVSDMTNNIQVSDTAPGKLIDAALAATVRWITSDAVKAILDIRDYFAASPPRVNPTSLIAHEFALESDRALVNSNVQTASSLLGTTLSPIKIPLLSLLPLPIGTAALAQDTLKQINTDIAGCTYALSESAAYLHGALAQTLSPAQSSTDRRMVVKERLACSPLNSGVLDLLNNIGFSASPAGAQLNAAYHQTIQWVVDADGYIAAVKNYFEGTSRSQTEAAVTTSTRQLRHDDAIVQRDLHSAARLQGILLTPIPLPSTPLP